MDFENPSLSSIISETCVRLIEMEEISDRSSAKFLWALGRLAAESIPAYRLMLTICTSSENIVSSHSELAARRGLTRQAAHKDFHIQLNYIELYFPDIVSHIKHLRESAHAGHGNDNSKHTDNK